MGKAPFAGTPRPYLKISFQWHHITTASLLPDTVTARESRTSTDLLWS